eukprot:m.186001 g.186001  ORF g.186001 m.186001 type:complete len:92 (-) comp18491_c1_seq65:139-414(-)
MHKEDECCYMWPKVYDSRSMEMHRQPGARSTMEAKGVPQNPYREFFNLLTRPVQVALLEDNAYDTALFQYAQALYHNLCLSKEGNLTQRRR